MSNLARQRLKETEETRMRARTSREVQDIAKKQHIPYKTKNLFIHIPKTAGQSIYKAIDLPIEMHKELKNMGKRVNEDTFIFSVIRNPYDRAVSLYYYLKSRIRTKSCRDWNAAMCCLAQGVDINEFWLKFISPKQFAFQCKQFPMMRPQMDFLKHPDSPGIDPRIDKIIKFEKLQEEWEDMMKIRGFSALPHRNKSKNRSNLHWSEELHPETIEHLTNLYTKDFQQLPYQTHMPIKTTTTSEEVASNTTKKRYLITSADNGMRYWANRTKPILEKYAKKCNAELLVIPKTSRRNLTWVLFDAWEKSIELGDEHDYAWIDADIIIAEDAPDIFELGERLFFCQPDPFRRVHPMWNKNHQTYNVPNPRPYPVTAIVKWNNRHIKKILKWVNKNQEQFPARFGDQELVGAAIYHTETAMFYFPNTWHKMSRWMQKNTKFFHFAGSSKQSKISKVDSFCIKNKIKTI